MIRLLEVTKTYGTGASALSDVTLSIDKGEFVFLVGPSGSGKTTLLRLLIRDMTPTRGTITLNNVDIVSLPPGKIPQLRKQIGVVFQDLKMLMDRTIFENILLPLEMAGMDHLQAEQKVHTILKQVGIEEHAEKFPIQLSGGELQRAAIARALVFSPDILLADEPTGNLDNTTSWEIIKLLQDINKLGTTIIMATHNLDVVNSLDKRIVELEKGKLINDTKKAKEHKKGAEKGAEEEKAKETKNKDENS
ncbi:MAG TPA: cell division ATP-binding protein FtsE [Patescibacteria group bacterium]|nr:cell division ATP-binding protein FtsE [Patescibacteria group bacterium]